MQSLSRPPFFGKRYLSLTGPTAELKEPQVDLAQCSQSNWGGPQVQVCGHEEGCSQDPRDYLHFVGNRRAQTFQDVLAVECPLRTILWKISTSCEVTHESHFTDHKVDQHKRQYGEHFSLPKCERNKRLVYFTYN